MKTQMKTIKIVFITKDGNHFARQLRVSTGHGNDTNDEHIQKATWEEINRFLSHLATKLCTDSDLNTFPSCSGCPLGSGKLQCDSSITQVLQRQRGPRRGHGEATHCPTPQQPGLGEQPSPKQDSGTSRTLATRNVSPIWFSKSAEKVFSQGSRNKTQGKKQEKEKAFSQGSRDKTLGGK